MYLSGNLKPRRLKYERPTAFLSTVNLKFHLFKIKISYFYIKVDSFFFVIKVDSKVTDLTSRSSVKVQK